MRSELAPVIVGLLIIVSVVSSISMSAQSVGFRVVEGWCVDVPSVNGWVSVAAVDNDSFYAAEYGDVGDGNVLVVVKVVNGSVVWSRVLYRDSEGYLITSAVNGSSGRLWVALYNSSALVICGSGYCYKFSNLTITTGYGVLSVYGRYVVVGVWDKLFVFDTVSGVIKEYGIGMYVDSIMSNIMTVSNSTHVGICDVDTGSCRVFSVSGFDRVTKFLVDDWGRYYVIGRVGEVRGVAVLDGGLDVVLAYEFNLSAYSVSVITIYGPLGLGINPKGYYGTYIVSNEYPVVIGVDKRWIVYDDVENVVYADRIYGYNVGVISVESITVKVVYAGDVKVSPVVRSPSSVVDILNESYGGGGLSICKYTLDLVIGNDGGDAVVLGGSAESLEVYYLMMLFIVPVALVLGLLYERRKLLKSFEKILILQFPSPIPKVLLFP